MHEHKCRGIILCIIVTTVEKNRHFSMTFRFPLFPSTNLAAVGNLVLKASVHTHSYKQLLRCHLSDEFKGKIMRESSRHPG